jgi:hypothetical protein
MDLTGIVCEAVDCIHLDKDKVQWQAHVNMVMKFLVSILGVEFLKQQRAYQLLKRCGRKMFWEQTA